MSRDVWPHSVDLSCYNPTVPVVATKSRVVTEIE